MTVLPPLSGVFVELDDPPAEGFVRLSLYLDDHFIMDSSGKKLGRIVHGQAATTNMAFGGDDWRTLYFTTRSTLFSVNLKIPGLPVPAKKKTA